MDALGRYKMVIDDPITAQNPQALNLETGYRYDTLDNLKLVTQGVTCPETPVAPPNPPTAGCRYFYYDSLSRLTQSVQPETETTTYSYDAVG